MSSSAITVRQTRVHAVTATMGALCGLALTQLLPMIGLQLGIAAAIAAMVFFVVKRLPRWTAWLLVGVATGVAIYYLLALFWILNPAPASGSGSSGPR